MEQEVGTDVYGAAADDPAPSVGDLDPIEWPFQSRFIEVLGNQVHFVDEGQGPILPSSTWACGHSSGEMS